MRRTKPEKREVPPDVRYNSVDLQKFIHHILRRGKKSLAVSIVYDAMDMVKEKTGRNPLEVFELALKNVGPIMEVRPRRVGGATYQVPMEVPGERRLALAMRWIADAARARSGKSFAEKIAAELIDAANNQGNAVRKREETHKMAEANRAFSHYRV
ncbi:SSU ribosomal protein S7P [Bellilinea caldifistulae]|jgi:small subunit ribosomal protein S7|uniref:Small ribosomal subunit protein uS7 n=1 Tax=Bellilinea caldifistulae TaxID=360411 RepID=A0A0P6X2Q4_9CHLR|nr:30S ribosomal protein S7 [Bellilinea caldifistulae]KPL73680.1 30S ribosomal protein S7 [Bellilinea caldifistulae]GAP10330.1 SSU ribosomal protein S7P [Bellilinea caldifistulae]